MGLKIIQTYYTKYKIECIMFKKKFIIDKTYKS